MVEAEDPRRPLAVPDERVERRQERRAVPPADGRLERGRIGPRVGVPAADRHRHEAGGLDHRVDLVEEQAVVVGEIGARRDPQRAAALGDEAAQARRLGRLLAQQVGRDRALGEVVDAPPAAALDAHDLADVEQPLDRDLRLRPVPPLRARLRAAEVLRRQRAVGRAAARGRRRPPARWTSCQRLLAGAHAPPPEGEPRPLRLRQDRRRVRPVLERVAAPVGVLDPSRAATGPSRA